MSWLEENILARIKIKIMWFMKTDAHIDGELFELFLTSGIYKEYAERFLDPMQIDEVDISCYVG